MILKIEFATETQRAPRRLSTIRARTRTGTEEWIVHLLTFIAFARRPESSDRIVTAVEIDAEVVLVIVRLPEFFG